MFVNDMVPHGRNFTIDCCMRLQVLYANVKQTEQGEIPADQLIEWLYGEGQGAKMLGTHLEVPGAPSGGESPSKSVSGGFSPRHARTEQDIEKFGILSLRPFSAMVWFIKNSTSLKWTLSGILQNICRFNTNNVFFGVAHQNNFENFKV